MSDFWLIDGWRQQSRTTRDIDNYLQQAKQRGFKGYVVGRQGRTYWLACGSDALTSPTHDAALCVRNHFKKLKQAVYLSLWQGMIVCIAWQGERLQHCLSCPHDTDGMLQLELVLQRIKRQAEAQATVLIAKQTPTTLAEFCQQQLAQWQLLLEQPQLRDLKPTAALQLRSLQQLPPWQRRQRIWTSCLLLMLGGAASAWYLWPQFEAPPNEVVQRRLAPPPGTAVQLLEQLPQLFAGFEHFAGWQWRSAQLQGQSLQAIVVASYGRDDELGSQLPAGWQHQEQAQQVVLTRAVVSHELDLSSPAPETTWLIEGQRYFPQLSISRVQSNQNTDYRWQQWQLTLPTTTLTELTRLAALLQQPNLRIAALKLQNGKQLTAQITLRLYEPLPLTQGEANS
ncbi:hypothetical protein PSI9734_00108 [Pseudidiomarina piscicola]|uniref:Uncharacterized protein n=1 Tax=Pseudidiomarina piscicola TaxID=2614830 RepID=A0A6S6WT56_9GAMM|nr:hypothetical protein [Pseudidiomarina piscicola]CAB0149544.1 hypothetical protein PSI9734_00108 [Pseudidiomarina piscicola]VZT38992.1 hypothetical protein PSI9734_00108 [Pseudomonas aeruginosa]